MLTIPLFFLKKKVKYQMRELDISDISKYAQKIIFQNTIYMETFWKFQFDINSRNCTVLQNIILVISRIETDP